MTAPGAADVPLPDPPPRVPPLGSVHGALDRPGGGPDEAWLLEGERMAVAGRFGGEAPATVLVDGRATARLVAPGPTAVNAVVSPGRLRRERVGPGAYLHEILLVPPSLPLLAWQLRGDVDVGPDRLARLRITLLPGDSRVHHRVRGGVVAATSAADPGHVVALSVDPPPDRLDVRPAPGGGLEVEVAAAGERVSVLLAVAPRARTRSAFRPGAHLAAHEEAALRGTRSVQVGGDLRRHADAVAWAGTRVERALVRMAAPRDLDAVLACALAATCTGAFDAARGALAALEAHGIRDPRHALLAGRYGLASGDVGPARRVAAAALDGSAAAGWTAGPPPLLGAAWTAVAEALRYAAPPDAQERLRGLAGPGASARGTPAPGEGDVSGPTGTDGVAPAASVPRRLPMLGREADPTHVPPAVALAALLDPDAPSPAGALPWEALGPLALLRSGRATDAWRAWALGVEGWSAARAGVDGAVPPLPTPAACALLVLLGGLLGLRPDAPVGRVHVAPTLPGDLEELTFEALRVGDAVFDLACRKDAAGWTFEIVPTGGRAPPLLVLAPRGSSGVPARVLVDGAAADVEVRHWGDGWTAGLQIPLDGPREVRFETE